MKIRLKPLVVLLSTMGMVSAVYADPSADQMTAELKAVNKQMQQLQSEINRLQNQVGTLKTKLKKQSRQSIVIKSSPGILAPPPSSIQPVKLASTQRPLTTVRSTPGVIPATQAESKVDSAPASSQIKSSMDQGLMGALSQSVTIAPYTGTPTYFDGHELVVNDPSINQDVKLLNRRDQEMSYYNSIGAFNIGQRPRVVLSGAVEGTAQYSNPYHGIASSDINLGTAKLESFIEGTPWISGFMSFAYDSSSGITSANRIDNSRLFLDEGFVTIGNLLKSPFYGTIGQIYLPFGRYASSMISSPLTSFVGEAKGRAITMGYRPGDNRPYASLFTFHSAANNNHNQINAYGTDLGYSIQFSKVNGDVGLSYISNIGDAFGLQDNGLSSPDFQGFAHDTVVNGQGYQAENVINTVPGGDLHTVIGFGPFALIAEYVTALRGYNTQDVTFDGHGAMPSSLNTELTYSFILWTKPSTFTLDYGFTRQALALNVPRTRFGGVFQVAILQHTLLALEYRHDLNYGRHAFATGFNAQAYVPSQLGGASNTVTAQLGLFF